MGICDIHIDRNIFLKSVGQVKWRNICNGWDGGTRPLACLILFATVNLFETNTHCYFSIKYWETGDIYLPSIICITLSQAYWIKQTYKPYTLAGPTVTGPVVDTLAVNTSITDYIFVSFAISFNWLQI